MRTQEKEIVAMLLAGGQGSRLKKLTRKLAKPAVPFGGKYRIIDFTLSNCSNSDIDTVGVLTQYQPQVLNSYIGIGSPWDLDRRDGGVTILQPYVGAKGGRWYRGTANAIYENMDFIDKYNAEYVLILSGDHIYKMDYSLLLEHHKQKSADATIAVIEVPFDEAHRFGIMNIDENEKIYEFYEKPKNPKSNLASMGVYIFNWKVLKQYLIEDEEDGNSSNDFGKNIIPKMLNNGLNIYAYIFNAYWKDVGTVRSLWEANMDLLKKDNELNLHDRSWKIYSNNPTSPSHYVSSTGSVKSSMLNEGCIVHGQVENSVLFPGVYIGKDSKVIDSIIMPNVKIEDKVLVNKAIVMSGVIVKQGSEISSEGQDEIIVINE